ncbi:hypothetical protein SAMN05192544_1018121 [Paraburkholderia hospita]|nr:hypothetical protein SAMN05192544_1018121 [Paraburkholderia hospita]
MSARLPNWPSGSSSRLLPAAAFGFDFAVRRLSMWFALRLRGHPRIAFVLQALPLCGAAKKSRCRPAQGRRLNGKHRNADASANTSKPNRPRHEAKPRLPAQHQNHKQKRPAQRKQPLLAGHQSTTTKPYLARNLLSVSSTICSGLSSILTVIASSSPGSSSVSSWLCSNEGSKKCPVRVCRRSCSTSCEPLR